jgi:catalase
LLVRIYSALLTLAHEYEHLVGALTFELSKCDDEMVTHGMIKRLNDIDFNLAKTVALNVGVPAPQKAGRPNHGKKDKNLSQTAFIPKNPTIATRRIAILVADGFDLAQVTAVRGALSAQGALTFIIGNRRGHIKSSSQTSSDSQESGLGADFSWESGRSTLFDAIYVPGGAQSALTLRETGRTVHWVREAFHHCKAIAASGEGVDFIHQACELPGIKLAINPSDSTPVVDMGVVSVGKFTTSEQFKLKVGSGNDFVSLFATEISKHRCWERSNLAAKVAA